MPAKNPITVPKPQFTQTLKFLLKRNCFGLKTVFNPFLQNSSATDRHLLNMANSLPKQLSMYGNNLVLYQHVSITLDEQTSDFHTI